MKKVVLGLMFILSMSLFSIDIKIGNYSVAEFYDGEYDVYEDVKLLVSYSDVLDMYSIKLMEEGYTELEIIFYEQQIQHNRLIDIEGSDGFNFYFKKNEIIMYEDEIDSYLICKIE